MTRRADWLANDEGDLQPGVALELQRMELQQRPPDAIHQNLVNRAALRPYILVVLLFLTMTTVSYIFGRLHKTSEAQTALLERYKSTVTAPTIITQTKNTASVVGTNVNLRSAPLLNAQTIACLNQGDQVEVVSYLIGWFQILHGQQRGWIFGAFLKKAENTYPAGGVLVRNLKLSDGSRLTAGTKVLLEERLPSNNILVLFPNGRRIEGPADAFLLH